MLVQRSLSLDEAMRAIATVVADAKSKGANIAVVVVDRTGEIIASAKMDGRSARFMKAAHRKAYSAAIFEMDTDGIINFWNRQAEHGHRGPSDWNDPMLTTLPGGLCVVYDGKVVGAVSVAGGTSVPGAGDWELAQIAFDALGPGFTHTNQMHQDKPVYLEAQ